MSFSFEAFLAWLLFLSLLFSVSLKFSSHSQLLRFGTHTTTIVLTLDRSLCYTPSFNTSSYVYYLRRSPFLLKFTFTSFLTAFILSELSHIQTHYYVYPHIYTKSFNIHIYVKKYIYMHMCVQTSIWLSLNSVNRLSF